MSGVDRLDSAVDKFDKILVKVLSCSRPKGCEFELPKDLP